MDAEKDLLVNDLEKQETKEEIEKFVEDAVLLGHEDIAELGRQKIAQLEASASSAQEIDGSKIIQIEEQGGSKEEISKRTEGFNQEINEIEKLAKKEIKEIKIENDGSNIRDNKVEDLSIEELDQLKKDKEEAEKKIADLKQVLDSMWADIINLEEQKPKINGSFVDSEYKYFVEGLGTNFDDKINTLKSITQDMINELRNGNLDQIKKENLHKSIDSMNRLIENLKNGKQGNENYDTQQFIRFSRDVLQIIDDAYHNGSFISKHNGYYDKFLDAERGLYQYINKIRNDPKNIEIDNKKYALGKIYQEKTKEKQSIERGRNLIEGKIKEIEIRLSKTQ